MYAMVPVNASHMYLLYYGKNMQIVEKPTAKYLLVS